VKPGEKICLLEGRVHSYALTSKKPELAFEENS
jgi:hypothetical protein